MLNHDIPSAPSIPKWTEVTFTCPTCNTIVTYMHRTGRKRTYCSRACKPTPHTSKKKELTAAIADRDGWACSICRTAMDPTIKFPDPAAPTINHIIPLTKRDDVEDLMSLRLAHWKCNQFKGAGISPEEVQKREPRNDYLCMTLTSLDVLPPLREDTTRCWLYPDVVTVPGTSLHPRLYLFQNLIGKWGRAFTVSSVCKNPHCVRPNHHRITPRSPGEATQLRRSMDKKLKYESWDHDMFGLHAMYDARKDVK